MTTAQAFLGIFVFTAFCWLISENRKRVVVRDIVIGLALQFVIAILMLKVPLLRHSFELLNGLVLLLEESTKAGTSFVFGYLGGGGPLPFDPKTSGSTFILALQALPVVLIVSALSSLLFYWRILPLVVKAFSRMLEKTMGIGGAVGLGAAANVFLGMVEAPLFVRPYLKIMTRSELFVTMSCGMGSMAPERRGEIVALGFKSILAGTLATCMTGAIVGIITYPW